MKPFIDENLFLHSPIARELYHTWAEKEPIFDYHCHLSPQEILEDCSYENLTQLWLSGDHYKWRLMRARGVPEELITGRGDPEEKFLAWAGTVEKSIGNPLYVWTHLELKRYFGIDELLTTDSAREIWKASSEILKNPGFSARQLITKSNVAALCTTDDPTDDLAPHRAIEADASFPVKVLPAFRPETALHPEQANFASWVNKLAEASGHPISSMKEMEEALKIRMIYFKERGCVTADQSLASPDFTAGTRREAEQAFLKALSGEPLSPAEANAYQTQLLLSLGKSYHEVGFVMQLHLGVMRNLSRRMFALTGSDAGFDSVGDGISATSAAALFTDLDSQGQLPPTVIYSLNACDDDALASVLGCFQEGQFPQKMQLGAPWWFSDHRDGMEKQMKALANTGLLSGFIGMLTDSRSFLSYTRHEYFRRVLCNLVGGWAQAGDIPLDTEALGRMVRRICYQNAAEYFHL